MAGRVEVFGAVCDAVNETATIVVENAPDQVAVAQAEIGMTKLIRILTRVHESHYRGDVFHAPDFREMALNVKQSRLRATGLAVPPDRYRLRQADQLTEPRVPAWAKTTLSRIGQDEAAGGQELCTEDRLEHARAAATDELRREFAALVVRDDITVQQVLDRRPELQDDVTILLSGARVVEEQRAPSDGLVRVRVELPLERLWLIVRRGIERVEADPADADVTNSATAQESTPWNTLHVSLGYCSHCRPSRSKPHPVLKPSPRMRRRR
jgi:hypothetical protein